MPQKYIDIYFSILQFGFGGLLEVAPKAVRNILSADRTSQRIINIVGRLLTLPFKGLYYRNKYAKQIDYQKLEGVPWLLVTSKNNKDVLRLLKKQLPEAVYLTYEAAVTETEEIVPLLHFHIWLRCYKAPYIFWHFFKKYGRKTWEYMDYVFKGVGQYEASLYFLKKHRPSYIIFSNDHSIFPRALLLAAKALKIPTIYIQHASITPYFPPLDFDLNLLEGQATLDRYALNGRVIGQTKLVGMPKFDAYIPYRNTSTKVSRVGVCCNKMDEATDVEKLLIYLQKQLPNITLTFRPHPADTRVFQLPEGVLHSTSEEPVFEFLQKQDLIMAGNTSIHLEAVLLNVEAVYYEYAPYDKDLSDMYLYHQNELVERANTKEELVSLIKEKANQKELDIYKRAIYYNALVGKKEEGNSAALAVRYIHEFIENWPHSKI